MMKKNNKKGNRKSKGGYTLIEVLLYIVIAVIMISGISALFHLVLEGGAKSRTITEVEQQGSQIMHLITQTIRNAEGINSPTEGNSSSTLSLNVVDAGDDPTVFGISGGSIYINEGSGSNVDLMNSNVTASGLTFENVSRTGTPGSVKIEFTLEHVNSLGLNIYDYSKTFYGSATVRY